MAKAGLFCGVFTVMFMCSMCRWRWGRDKEVQYSLLSSLRPLPEPLEPCGGVGCVCQCYGNVADCTGRGLEFVPFFSTPITTLLIGGNRIRELLPGLFDNVTEIAILDLSNSGISSFNVEVFRKLQNLKVLDLSGNFLQNDRKIFHGLSTITTLEQVDLSITRVRYPKGRMTFKPEYISYEHPMPQLTILWINGYEVRELNLKEFKPLKMLRELSASDTLINNVIPAVMPSLQKLNLSNNNLSFFRSWRGFSFNASTESFYPNLTVLDLDGNGMKTLALNLDAPLCFPQLTHLSLQRNHIIRIPSRTFESIENNHHYKMNVFPRLKHLQLRNAGNDFVIEDTAFASSSLLTLDLSFNSLLFSSGKVSGDTFKGCVNILELNLEVNNFSRVSEAKLIQLFTPLESLQILSLGNTQLSNIGKWLSRTLRNLTELFLHNNQITVIPEGTFHEMRLLTKLRLNGNKILEIPDGAFGDLMHLHTLELDDNRLLEIYDGAFDDLENLVRLRLDGNRIRTVSEGTFSPDTRARLKSLILSSNPFECTCSLLWFRNWLISDHELFEYPNSPYECENMHGKDLVSFFLNEQQCLLGRDAFDTIVVSTVLFTAALILTAVLYRWHIRLIMYEAFRGNPQARWRQRRPEAFQYDLFVSYDSEDSRWVHEHLMPALEGGMGLRLCVHQRDFIPGKNIVDNIVDSLEVSKRVLSVFSPNFAESQWCHFELEMCLSHVVDNNDVMVIVILQHVPARDMSGAMLALVNTTTYIEWVEDPDAIASFWRRIMVALKDILPVE